MKGQQCTFPSAKIECAQRHGLRRAAERGLRRTSLRTTHALNLRTAVEIAAQRLSHALAGGMAACAWSAVRGTALIPRRGASRLPPETRRVDEHRNAYSAHAPRRAVHASKPSVAAGKLKALIDAHPRDAPVPWVALGQRPDLAAVASDEPTDRGLQHLTLQNN
jgi:hypothetical protein